MPLGKSDEPLIGVVWVDDSMHEGLGRCGHTPGYQSWHGKPASCTTGVVCPSINSLVMFSSRVSIIGVHNAKAAHQGEVCNYRPVHELIFNCVFECLPIDISIATLYDMSAQCDRLLLYHPTSERIHVIHRKSIHFVYTCRYMCHFVFVTFTRNDFGHRTQLDRAPSVGTGSSCERATH